jgi:hypothetical protein
MWMPDRVRHDAFAYLIAGLINGKPCATAVKDSENDEKTLS